MISVLLLSISSNNNPRNACAGEPLSPFVYTTFFAANWGCSFLAGIWGREEVECRDFVFVNNFLGWWESLGRPSKGWLDFCFPNNIC